MANFSCIDMKKRDAESLVKLSKAVEKFSKTTGFEISLLVFYTGKASKGKTTYIAGSDALSSSVEVSLPTISSAFNQRMVTSDSQPTPSTVQPLPDLRSQPYRPLHQLNIHSLRSLVPFLVCSTSKRSQPRWGKLDQTPSWWPSDLEFANPKIDFRPEDRRGEETWAACLRRVVYECYRFYEQEPLTGSPSPSESMDSETRESPHSSNQEESLLEPVCQDTFIVNTTLRRRVQELMKCQKVLQTTQKS
ncbi:DNA-binding protein Ewg-like [Ptychodera flava]|uniref:DNA-binding protein Ewg-like n=1 Tax=Ptychodera flava TaxID=63121 RepID=UPI00396A6459